MKNLENKVGVTGAGGQAYADISRMSGARDGSRSQGARAAKFIIRSYPPVLNQYLTVLGQAGANVNGIQPLRERTRQGGDYDWQEVQMIDNRIKQLLGIAKNVQIQSNDAHITLPQKPQWSPRPKQQTQPQEPELPTIDTNIEIEEPEINVPDFEDLDTSTPEVKQMAYKDPGTKDQTLKERDYVDVIIDRMREMCSDTSASLKVKRNWLDGGYNNGVKYINSLVASGDLTKKEAKLQIQKLTYYYKQFIKGDKNAMFGQRTTQQEPQQPQRQEPVLAEQEFKKLVKQILREEFFK